MKRPLFSVVQRAALPKAAKAVALTLADRADSAGQCWPSVKLLAASTGQSESTVRRALRWLESQGLVMVQCRYQDGAQITSLYTVNRKAFDTLPPAADDRRGQSSVVVAPQSPRLTKTPSIKTPSEDTQSKELLRSSAKVPNIQQVGELDLREYDDWPDTLNPLAREQHPAGKAKKMERALKPISAWSNADIAFDFAYQASLYAPKMANRCNEQAMAKALKLERDKTGLSPELLVAATDAFFADPGRWQNAEALWKLYLASLSQLLVVAESTVMDARELRQGHRENDPRPRRERDPWEERNKYRIAHGLTPLQKPQETS